MSEGFTFPREPFRFSTIATKPFDWCMNRDMYKTMGGLLIYGTALNAGTTRNFDIYDREEIKKAARMLIGKPLELDEHGNVMNPENAVLDAEAVDDGARIEYVARVLDKRTMQRIESGDLKWVSFNGMCRRTPDQLPGDPRGCEGLFLFRLCLVGETSPLPPADPETSLQLWRQATMNPQFSEGFGVANFDKMEAGDVVPVNPEDARIAREIQRRIAKNGK